jgi:tetratricopeptide (TPR) repeat protein
VIFRIIESVQNAYLERVIPQTYEAFDAGLLEVARDRANSVLQDFSEHADALYILGLVAKHSGRMQNALNFLIRAILARPNWPDPYVELCRLAWRGQLFREADQVVALIERNFSNNVRTLLDLAEVFGDSRLEKVNRLLVRAVELDPSSAEGWRQLAVNLSTLGRFREADDALAHLRMLDSDGFDYDAAMFSRYSESGESTRACHHALAVFERTARAEFVTGAFNAALESGDKVLIERVFVLSKSVPKAPQVYFEFCYGQHLLRQGNVLGFAGYEQRVRMGTGSTAPIPEGKQWDGTPLGTNDALLVQYEQGIGDELMFCRFVPGLSGMAKRVYYIVHASLYPLLGAQPNLFGVSVVCEGTMDAVEAEKKSSKFVNLMSIPRLLALNQITAPMAPYIEAIGGANAPLRREISALEGLKVGLVWKAMRSGGIGRRKSVPDEALSRLWAMPGIQWVSLQKDPEIEFPSDVVDLSSKLDSFADTADAVAALDIVVSVDTSVAHLAAAMGKPLIVLSRASIDWRWAGESQGTFWYRNVEVIRQSNEAIGWDSVIDDLIASLRARRDSR